MTVQTPEMRVDVKPELLRWAVDRSRIDAESLARRFPKFEEWEERTSQPTLRQLEDFARATHTPIGFLFLQQPPDEKVPIPDFRTIGGKAVGRPSPDLLDTIYICQQRQEWFTDFSRLMREEPLAFVGSANVTDNVVDAAARIRAALRFDVEEQRKSPTWTEALRRFIERADSLGVLVMVNGVVGNNNRRKLDPEEFRGFALSDPFAPLIFINGADTKSAQMFTLAHELAHLWLGATALSDNSPISTPTNRVEQWCNKVAAELLVPLALIKKEIRQGASLRDELDRLARFFKVSTLVILRRMHDAGALSDNKLRTAYDEELALLLSKAKGSGGDFYLTQSARVGKRFARALVVSTLEGQTLHTEALRLLGFSKFSTFEKLGTSLGVV